MVACTCSVSMHKNEQVPKYTVLADKSTSFFFWFISFFPFGLEFLSQAHQGTQFLLCGVVLSAARPKMEVSSHNAFCHLHDKAQLTRALYQRRGHTCFMRCWFFGGKGRGSGAVHDNENNDDNDDNNNHKDNGTVSQIGRSARQAAGAA